MGIFGFKRQTEKTADTRKVVSSTKAKKSTVTAKSSPKVPKEKKDKSTNIVVAPIGVFNSSTESIIKPHITEKSGLLSRNGIYTFEITSNANKNSVSNAIKVLYKVNPTKVSIINLPDKKVFVRGKRGVVSGVRKALVTIKKGEKIDFV